MRTDLWNILEPVEVDPRVKSWKDVLRNLVFHCNTDGEAWPSIETIRREVGYKSRKAVIDALAGLEHCGLMKRVRSGKGCGTKYVYMLTIDDTSVCKLKESEDNPVDGVDKSNKGEVSSPLEPVDSVDKCDKGEVSSPLDGDKGEVSSPLKGSKGEVTSRKGEVTSRKGEVTSHRIYKEIIKNSPSPSIGPKGEVTSPFVDNSAEELPEPHGSEPKEIAPSARKDAGGVPKRIGVMALLDPDPNVDYLALCKKPGWKPNDPKQTPPCDFQKAKAAVLECAYQQRLSREKAKEFWHYNAIRKWNAIDCGNTIAELAHAFMERWWKEDADAYWAEQKRRQRSAYSRVMS